MESPSTPAPAVEATEVRLLEGPNLYFTRPALKVMLSMPGYLDAPAPALRELTARLGMRARVGEPGSAQRRAFLGRLAAFVIRGVARAAGSSRIGVRVRPGAGPADVVVAAVWRRRGRALAIGDGLAGLLAGLLAGADPAELLSAAGAEVRDAPAGRPPTALAPTVPVASITGTNGKTTTTRLVAHMAMTAGKKTAWSSTDGVVVMGEMVEPGDYSGPAGARGVLETPGLEIGVLETARGGLLLRGMGVTHNDVSVVTNVSADHLGMQGIDTLDQLAEVKAIVTTVTRPDGWCVLNGEDPRVWAMRTRAKGRPWAFALDPTAPALREAIDGGGRGITVLDGDVTVLLAGGATERLLPVVDIGATLSGLSVHNTANVLAATAAGLGLGLPKDAVLEALRSFSTDDQHNPGRMNIYTIPLGGDSAARGARPGGSAPAVGSGTPAARSGAPDADASGGRAARDGKGSVDGGNPAGAGGATVILDMAHNEAGLVALMDVARGLTAPGGRVMLALGTAGDRTDEILAALGQIAGQRADQVVIAHKEHYLRGRTTQEFEERFGDGLALAGVGAVPGYPNELAALTGLAENAVDGDVIAVMSHEQRLASLAWIAEVGGTADSPGDVRRKVKVATGVHELEAEFAALWALDDPAARVAAARALHTAHPRDARVTFEYAGALDSVGAEAEAVPLYREALAAGLREPHRHQAGIQLASSLRVLGRPVEAIALLDELAAERPESAAIVAFRALARLDAGQGPTVVADLIDALLARAADEDTQLYRAALTRYVADLRP